MFITQFTFKHMLESTTSSGLEGLRQYSVFSNVYYVKWYAFVHKWHVKW